MRAKLQAHRGVSTDYPENTLAAFDAAADEGYAIVECDPKYTGDGVIVMHHDRTTARTGRTADGKPAPDKNVSDYVRRTARAGLRAVEEREVPRRKNPDAIGNA